MKRVIFPILAVVLSITVGCNKYDDGLKQMTLTFQGSGEKTISMHGIGTATIDWGDGSKIETIILSPGSFGDMFPTNQNIKHNYTGSSIRTITITGENITGLNCVSNQLTKLDVSKNSALIELYCQYNQLTNLDISKNTALKWLICSSNQLTSLDVSQNTELTLLDCLNNQLTNLDVSKNTKLTFLSCSFNPLKKIDVSKNTVLTRLDCYNNQLTSLDVSGNIVLAFLHCSSNQLTNLDVSKNAELGYLDCSDNLLTNYSLNELFEILHDNSVGYQKQIVIQRNPGANDCDRSIAERKGWTFRQY